MTASKLYPDQVAKAIVNKFERLIRDVVIEMQSDNVMDSVRLHDTKEDLISFITYNLKLK